MITDQEIQAIVAKHNKYRENEPYNCPPLKSDKIINTFAQSRADAIANSGKFQHACNLPYGENLWMSSNTKPSDISCCVDSWMSERYSWDPAKNNWIDGLGHFSQCVWRNSTEIGCGKSIMTDSSGRNFLVIVCNYNPPGNMVGQFPY